MKDKKLLRYILILNLVCFAKANAASGYAYDLLSPRGVALIQQLEGDTFEIPDDDGAGNPTIGVGHRIFEKDWGPRGELGALGITKDRFEKPAGASKHWMPRPLTDDEVAALLQQDIVKRADIRGPLGEAFDGLDTNEKDALISLPLMLEWEPLQKVIYLAIY